jgi:hypothetical protein
VSYGTDTTIVSSTAPTTTLMRIDVSPNAPSTNLRALAQPQINALEQEPGYHLISLNNTTVAGFRALHWEFTDEQEGVLVQKEDDFFVDTDNDDGVAILTQAPASDYAADAGPFAEYRASLVMN